MSMGAFQAELCVSQQRLCERELSFILTGSRILTLLMNKLILFNWISSNIRRKTLEQ